MDEVAGGPSLAAGGVVGGCRILGLIGRGGMGAVYRAHQVDLDREVALKVLVHADPTSELVRRFEREMKVHIRLAHPHLVRVYAAGIDRGIYYLVLEIVRGATLRSSIRRSPPMSWEEAAGRLGQILEALIYLDESGLIHRDLKPENILVEEGSTHLKLADFGLVKPEGASALSKANQIVGTLRYLAPEVLHGTPVDSRIDVYSAGLIFYELLAGRLPFDATDVPGWVREVLHRPAPDIRDFRQDLDPFQSDLVAAMLEKHPENRPRAREALERLSSRRWSPALRSPPPPRWRGGRRFPWSRTVMVLILIVTGLTFALLPRPPFRAAVTGLSSGPIATPDPRPARAPVAWARQIPAELVPGVPVLPHWSAPLSRDGAELSSADWQKIFQHNCQLESRGEGDTLLALAIQYGRGLGVARNLGFAQAYLGRAIRTGNGFALLCIDWSSPIASSLSGGNLDRELVHRRAESWFQARCLEGNLAAQVEHARTLFWIEGRKDEARLLLEQAANKGFVPACSELGELFLDTHHGPADEAQALAWYARGAASKDPICLREMALLLRSRSAGDREEAIRLLEASTRAGDPLAAFHLGRMRIEQDPPDRAQAATWFHRSLSLCERQAFQDTPMHAWLEKDLAFRGASLAPTGQSSAEFLRRSLGLAP